MAPLWALRAVQLPIDVLALSWPYRWPYLPELVILHSLRDIVDLRKFVLNELTAQSEFIEEKVARAQPASLFTRGREYRIYRDRLVRRG